MAFENRSGEWSWPLDLHETCARPSGEEKPKPSIPGAFPPSTDTHHDLNSSTKSTSNPSPQSKRQGGPKPARNWLPRTCRICLETVLPTFHPPSQNIPNILQPSPTVTYDCEDPTSGRLLRPCKCKGTSKYVHEGCLQNWRHADPAYGSRNYWQCPTCGFRYRLQRMTWGRWISSSASQIVLTVTIFFLAMFVSGFVADPIINLYLDPYGTISSASRLGTKLEPILTNEEVTTWPEHFLKGLASLGLLSFVKFLFALSPWQWWNLRTSGLMSSSNRTGATGRDRLQNISWVVVVIGVGTFLWVCHQKRIPISDID
jgi:hypothetical protein